MFTRWTSLRWGGTDEGADPTPCFKYAGPLELRVDAGDGVRVDPEGHRELSDRGQLVARSDAFRGNRRPQAAFQLGVDGRAVPRVDTDDIHMTYCTSKLEQVKQEIGPATPTV